jgi:hypothetical protein
MQFARSLVITVLLATAASAASAQQPSFTWRGSNSADVALLHVSASDTFTISADHPVFVRNKGIEVMSADASQEFIRFSPDYRTFSVDHGSTWRPVASLRTASFADDQQLPSPGVERETPVAVASAPTANYFELAHFDTSNRPDGIAVDIWWNAYQKAGDDKTLVKNMGPATYTGARLMAVAADARTRANNYVTAGQPAGVAYILGQRDAIYAALQADGYIPAETP